MARTITSDVIAGKILVTALPKIRNAGKNERHSIEKPNGYEKVHNTQLENSLRMQAKPYGMRLVEINDTTVTLEKTY